MRNAWRFFRERVKLTREFRSYWGWRNAWRTAGRTLDIERRMDAMHSYPNWGEWETFEAEEAFVYGPGGEALPADTLGP